jgi:hypothetical protein
MPTAIPNFLNNTQSPLGAAFANLSSVLTSAPSDAERYSAADTALLKHRQVQGQQSLADMLRGMSVAGAAPSSTQAPVPVDMPQAPQFGTAGGDVSAKANPIMHAFSSTAPTAQPQDASNTPTRMPGGTDLYFDPAQEAAAALYAGIDPKTLGGYQQNIMANQFGARDNRVTNATVGAGEPYSSTAQSFDINQANDLTKADNTNKTSRDNNAATVAASRQNNADSLANARALESMKEKHGDSQDAATTSGMTPEHLDYVADIYRRTGQLPALGMGKQAALLREEILGRAADLDKGDGRTGADAVATFADYQGQKQTARTEGARQGTADMAVNELQNLIPTAKAAMAPLARTGFVPADTLLNAYQNGTDNTDLARAAVAVNDVVNAHARAINPQGLVTDAGRAAGYALLRTAQNQAAFNATLDQMSVGAAAAKKSPGQAQADLGARVSAPLVAHGSAPAAPAAGGWTVQKVGP